MPRTIKCIQQLISSRSAVQSLIWLGHSWLEPGLPSPAGDTSVRFSYFTAQCALSMLKTHIVAGEIINKASYAHVDLPIPTLIYEVCVVII
jgi:hypothetical protein